MTTQNKDLQSIFTQAYIILTASVLRAGKLREQADMVKDSKNINTWIKNTNKKHSLLSMADHVENRGRKVWANVGDFQGKHVNWRNLTDEGKSIFEMYVNTSSLYDKILPIAKKLA